MTLISVQLGNQRYDIDGDNPINIAIPLDFAGKQPNAYDVEKAESKAYETGNLVGDTRRGGSCNFEKIDFIPHCNGTHTECVGHITHERISIHNCLKDAFILATLISVTPQAGNSTSETYPILLANNDKLITRKSIEEALQSADFQASNFESTEFPRALIIRTLPNSEDKLSKTYLTEIPPFFSTEAMNFMRGLGIKHLLVDLPSIDRLFDEGKLSNHRIFWNVEQGIFETSDRTLTNNTITELIYAPDEIKDGAYLLNLQIAPFIADAAPSRPVLFEIRS